MAENTEISWCDHTQNLWWGCTEVHEGCDNCYARTLAHRWGFEVWGVPGSEGGVRRIIKSAWKDLARFQKKAAEAGVIRTVFVGSMMDIFEKSMPVVDDKGEGVFYSAAPFGDECEMDTSHLRSRLFREISEGHYPNLLFLLLTKRPSNINKYIPEAWRINGAPNNVMFGTSVVNQETADKLIPQLLQLKGRRFLSMEPLLGSVDLTDVKTVVFRGAEIVDALTGTLMDFTHDICPNRLSSAIEWVIVGGESGHNARHMHPDWARSLRDQCQDAGVKFHFKQWGEWLPFTQFEKAGISIFRADVVPGESLYRDATILTKDNWQGPAGNASTMYKVGKKAAGRLLDGVEHNALAV